jgi:hypothetical protein
MPTQLPPHTPIDAVITWVDGDDPMHRRKRERFLGIAQDDLHENGINPHRWACSDELSFCLRSLENHAPWLRTIFIVTDAQTPDLSGLSMALRTKIEIVDHTAIFVGYEQALPTFNSLAIESMLWRIEGLAEHFVYFNDDVFLTAPLCPSDVFTANGPVLRGKWVDHSKLGDNPEDLSDPTKFHDFMQVNAAAFLGFARDQIFASAHVAFPMQRSVFEALFEAHKKAFLNNIAYKFRDIAQFQPQGLHNCACIQAGACEVQAEIDYLHLRTGAVEDFPLNVVRAFLSKALAPEIKFLCVNDLRQVEDAIPDARDWIEAAIGVVRVAA